MAESLEYGRISFEFAEELDHLSDPDDVWNAMRRITAPFGVELYGFFARVPGPGEPLDTIAFNKQIPELADWLKHYDDRRYAEIDPVMRRLRRHSVRSFAHDEVSYDLDPRALELKQRRSDFGFGNGFSIPIFGSTGANGFMSFGIKGLKPDLPTHNKRTIHLITLYAADRIGSLRSTQSAYKPIVTNRQREVLTWVAAGKSSWEIGEILNISARTVEEHAQRVLQRLGAVNRTQAVAIAIRDRLIAI
jgi:LuxR family quorum sensing-dependent transcriptional regulator